jgi:hypothetical protein
MSERRMDLGNGVVIELDPDQDAENPREAWDNACTMVCFHRRYVLGDKDHGYEASQFDGFEELRKQIVKDHDPVVIVPVGLLDHSGLTMFVGRGPHWTDSQGWDSGQIGWAFMTKKQILDNLAGQGKKNLTKKLVEMAEKAIKCEVETFNQYLNGDVWEYTIEKNGARVDSLCGMYGYEYALETAKEAAAGFAAEGK